MTFLIKWKGDKYTSDSDKTGTVFFNGKQLCDIRGWAFHSCACHGLENWNTWAIQEAAFTGDEFWEFLSSKHLGWIPDETMLLISDTQLPFLKKIWQHPKVKLRDKFLNKAHGPNCVYLFRYSKTGDWKRRSVNA
jgi:hypothetical protein